MRTWTRMGATALGTSILLVGPAAAVASAAQPAGQPAGPAPTGPAPVGPPPARPAMQAATQVYVLPTRERGTARADSIRLLRLADTVQIA